MNTTDTKCVGLPGKKELKWQDLSLLLAVTTVAIIDVLIQWRPRYALISVTGISFANFGALLELFFTGYEYCLLGVLIAEEGQDNQLQKLHKEES
jgi:hypothetical protein